MASATAHQTQLEIELKLDADSRFVLPDLSGLPGVEAVEPAGTVSLEAIYLDTPDLRLTRSGISLRRRTGGSDAGWHLKLPVGEDRLEVHRGVGRSVRTIPPALTGLVRARLRGATPAPVARLATERTTLRLLGAGGTVLAEVADDAVTANRLGEVTTIDTWRELEVELVEGDRALLKAAGEALTAAGARPAATTSKIRRALGDPSEPVRKRRKKGPTAGDVALDHLREHAAALVAQDPRVRLDAEDSVHQMRVAARRLRSALATFRPLFAEGAGEPLRAELKWLGEVLGRARDAEVLHAALTRSLADQPAELVVGPVRRRIDLELREEEKLARERVLEALDGERYLALLEALDAFVAEPPLTDRAARPGAKEARGLVRKSYKRVVTAVQAVDVDHGDHVDHDHPLHEVRKAAKRARYAAEAVLPAVGGPAKHLAKAMEAVQETLGDHQDSVVERIWLRDLAMRAQGNGENGFTFGRLHGLAEARARHDEEVFAEAWAAAQRRAARWPGKTGDLV